MSPKRFFGAFSAGGPLLLSTLGPGLALDGPVWLPQLLDSGPWIVIKISESAYDSSSF